MFKLNIKLVNDRQGDKTYRPGTGKLWPANCIRPPNCSVCPWAKHVFYLFKQLEKKPIFPNMWKWREIQISMSISEFFFNPQLRTCLERGKEREKHQYERETSNNCLLYVTRPGTEPATFRFTGQSSNRATPASAISEILLEHSHAHLWQSVAASAIRWQNQIVATKTVWPTRPKMFVIWPFAETVCSPLL